MIKSVNGRGFYVRSALALFFFMYAAAAQGTDDSVAFEVASVRPHVPVPGEKGGFTQKGGPGTDDPGHIAIGNKTLRNLIIDAYGIRNFQIEHPGWMGDLRYDIMAKVPAGTTRQQANAMMRNLLTERFQLKVSKEKRDLPVYGLTVAKSGVKMKSADPGSTPQLRTEFVNGRATVKAEHQSMSKLVTWLTGEMTHPVINLTKVAGDFDFSLTWSGEPEDLVAAVKQLGLQMDRRKMPFDYLIIESALKVPTEN